MGLMNKIEEKLSGSSNKDDRVHDNEYGSSTTHPYGSAVNHPQGQSSLDYPTGQHSSLNHPTTATTTTTTQGIGSNSGITGGTLAGGVPSASHGQSVHGSNLTGTHGSNTHGTPVVGTHGSNAAYDSRVSDTHHREGAHIPGTHGTHGSSNTTTQGSHIPGIHSSSNTSSHHHQGATHHIPGTSSHQDRTSHDEYGVNRSRDGGVTNQGVGHEGGSNMNVISGPHKELQNPAAIPTAGGQKVGDGVSGSDPYDSSSTSTTHHQHGQHHHGRDAALGAGAGAGLGAGAAAIGHHGDRHETATHPSSTTTGYGDNVSYMNRPSADSSLAKESGYTQRHGDASHGLGQHQQDYQTSQRNTSSSMPGSQTTQQQAGLVGGMSGMSISKKLAGAYEAGYRDGVEHTRAEMQHHGR